MSAEVAVKKRGRPKKVILDSVEMEVLETKKSTSRSKSTKATPKTTNTKTVAPAKTPVVEKPTPTPIEVPTSPPKTTLKAAPASTTPISQAAAAKPPIQSPVTPETSKILGKVRELSAKNPQQPPIEPTKSSNPSSATIAANTSPPTSTQPKSAPSQTSLPSKPSTTLSKTRLLPPQPKVQLSPPFNAPKSKAYIPIAAMNSAVVSNISERAGARPNKEGSRALPKGYKPVARRITMAIVAMPIAIVTSWVLYQRLVLGEDRKLLVKPGMAMVESFGAEELKTEENR